MPAMFLKFKKRVLEKTYTMLYFCVQILHIFNFHAHKYEDFISVAHLFMYSEPSASKKKYLKKLQFYF